MVDRMQKIQLQTSMFSDVIGVVCFMTPPHLTQGQLDYSVQCCALFIVDPITAVSVFLDVGLCVRLIQFPCSM